MDSPYRTDLFTFIIGAVACCVWAGCSDAVRLSGESDNGGVVTYLVKEGRGGPMGSPHRKEAVTLIDRKCPAGYRVLREGEVAGPASLSRMEGQESDVTGRRWGIQFQCK